MVGLGEAAAVAADDAPEHRVGRELEPGVPTTTHVELALDAVGGALRGHGACRAPPRSRGRGDGDRSSVRQVDLGGPPTPVSGDRGLDGTVQAVLAPGLQAVEPEGDPLRAGARVEASRRSWPSVTAAATRTDG